VYFQVNYQGDISASISWQITAGDRGSWWQLLWQQGLTPLLLVSLSSVQHSIIQSHISLESCSSRSQYAVREYKLGGLKAVTPAGCSLGQSPTVFSQHTNSTNI